MAASFTDTYKRSYSHGLERIYALENIDIKTVKPINGAEEIIDKAAAYPLADADQLEFDFGIAFRNWLQPLVLQEPIQVLHLNQAAEKILLQYQKRSICDLLNTCSADFIFFKGLGQGHIDEIQKKLKLYLERKPPQRSRLIDFEALLLILLDGFERKKASPLLEKYGLDMKLSLSHFEKAEICRWNAEERKEAEKEFISALTTIEKRHLLERLLKEAIFALVLPWIRNRGGIATEVELNERLVRVSIHPQMTPSVLQFFSSVYFSGHFILSDFLHEVEMGVFCIDDQGAKDFRNIVEKAMTYFYHDGVRYMLDEMMSYLEREFATTWQSFPDRFIERVLTTSSLFRTFKDAKGVLNIRLNS